jgi:hypothetical protein
MKLRLKKEIYSRLTVEKGKQDYAQIANIEIGENETEWLLDINTSDYDLNLVSSEFENYLIGLEN